MESDLNPTSPYKRRRRAIELVLSALVVAVLVIVASQTSPWRLAELKVFDYFSTASPPPTAERRVRVIRAFSHIFRLCAAS